MSKFNLKSGLLFAALGMAVFGLVLALVVPHHVIATSLAETRVDIPAISRPSHPQKPPRLNIDFNREGPWVAITSPLDGPAENRLEPLEVEVQYKSKHVDVNLNGKTVVSVPAGLLMAVELLLNSESAGIQKVSQTASGTALFFIDLTDLPGDAKEVRLQARAYDRYFAPITTPRGTRNLIRNRIAAESEPILVNFKDVVGSEGGVVTAQDGISIIVPAGAFTVPTIVEAGNDPTTEQVISVENMTMLSSIALNMGDTDTNVSVDMSVPNTAGLTAENQILVGQLVWQGDGFKYVLVDFATVENDKLVSHLLPELFEGIKSSGIFSFFSPQNTIGYVTGHVRNPDGTPIKNAVVSISKLPQFVAETKSDGSYLLPGVVGSFSLTAFDPNTGDTSTVAGAVPDKNATVSIDITISPSSIPLNNLLLNGGFENNLSAWTPEGEVSNIKGLGAGSDGIIGTSDDSIRPTEGTHMAMVSTGGGAVGDIASSLRQRFTIPKGTKSIAFDYNFVSEEFPEFRNSIYNDTMTVTITTPDKGAQTAATEDVNTADTKPVSGIDFPGGDNTTEMTDWKTKEIPLDGINGEVAITITDLGDTIYDSVILVDNFRLISDDGTATDVPFLEFPLHGKTKDTVVVTSIMDHHSLAPFCKDSVVEAYNGETSLTQPFKRSFAGYTCPTNKSDFLLKYRVKGADLHEFRRKKSGPLIGILNVKDTDQNDYLSYDGHPGYDFRTIDQDPDNGHVEVWSAYPGMLVIDPEEFRAVGRAKVFHHVNGVEFMTEYLHLDRIIVKGEDITPKLTDKEPVALEVEVEQIGISGDRCPSCKGGRVDPHLHFTVYKNLLKSEDKDWLEWPRVDPYGWIGTPTSKYYAPSKELWK